MQKVRERSTELQTELLFFDLEWNELPDDHVEPLLDDPALAFCAHHLRMLRRYRPHQLSEPEEQMLTETAVTGPSAFRRLFTELVSALRVELPYEDEPVPLMQALSNLQDPDRERRRQAAAGVTAALEPGLRTRALRDQHPGRRQGHQGPAAPLRPLAGLAQPVQRGQRRVGRGAHRRGAGPLRPGAALVPPQGEDPRPRPPGPLRPHGPAARVDRPHPLRRGPGAGARLLPRLLPRAGRGRGRASSPTATSTARPSPASAAAPSAPTPCPAPTPTCCSTTPRARATC